MITPVQRSMLVRFSQFARDVRYFASSPGGKAGDVAMSAPVAEKNLAALRALGYIVEIKTGYRITERGRAALDAPSDARYDRVTNGTQTERYEPKPWTSARSGADDFLNYSRRGF